MKNYIAFLFAIGCSTVANADVVCGKLKIGSFNSDPSIQYLLESSIGEITELDFSGTTNSQAEIDVLSLKKSIGDFLIDGQNYCFGGKPTQITSYPAISFNCVEVGTSANTCK